MKCGKKNNYEFLNIHLSICEYISRGSFLSQDILEREREREFNNDFHF